MGTRVSNLKSVGLTVLQLLAFNTQKFRGHVTLATPPFGKIFGVMSGLSLGTRMSNLKSVALTFLELLAFNSHRSAVHRHTDRNTETHTSNEHIISAIHLVHLAEIIRKKRKTVDRTSKRSKDVTNRCPQSKDATQTTILRKK